jgi:hypothetical protein
MANHENSDQIITRVIRAMLDDIDETAFGELRVRKAVQLFEFIGKEHVLSSATFAGNFSNNVKNKLREFNNDPQFGHDLASRLYTNLFGTNIDT